MRSDIHPNYQLVKIKCSCGNNFSINAAQDQHLDVCFKCHPFYTGKQKIIDSAGRVDRYFQKFGGLNLGGDA